jgi:L-serine dehydratase
MIGPVMIGPSSSHTAGALRIGNVAGSLLGELPCRIRVLFSGSFARTYRGHGTDKAVVAGVLGMRTDDENIPESLNIAKTKNIEVVFKTAEIKNSHPNTMRIVLEGESNAEVDICGSSIGGGNIIITEINGMKTEFNGQYPTTIIVHQDTPGIIASITNLIADSGVNIANMKDDRDYPKGDAHMLIETDQEISCQTIGRLKKMSSIHSIFVIPPVYDRN